MQLFAAPNQGNLNVVGGSAVSATPVWSLAGIVQSGQNVNLTGAVNIAPSFTASAADSNVTLETAIYDPSGMQVAVLSQTGVNFSAGQTIAANTLIYQAPASAVIGTYSAPFRSVVFEGQRRAGLLEMRRPRRLWCRPGRPRRSCQMSATRPFHGSTRMSVSCRAP